MLAFVCVSIFLINNLRRMKRSIFVLLLLAIFVTSIHSAEVLYRQVPLREALEIAKDQFPGADYDYYHLQDQSAVFWTIFVDAEPMKNWNHDCYLVKCPKNVEAGLSSPTSPSTVIPSISQTASPPIGRYIPLDVKIRYGANANSKPMVLKASSANADTDVAGRTYAIILSGGIQPISNHERYWNDCSFIYQTLVNKYLIPRNNIFPIMSDGTNPAADMHTVENTYVSQPLDLDFDGLNDIQLAANKSNVNTVLNQLIPKLERDDHLFLYVIDHGGSDDYVSKSYICLWNGEKLYDTELAEMLLPFTNKGVNVNVVLGQCFAGGFVEELTQAGCVVSAASTGSESSWGCTDIPYDEFVYQWTCAVNMANHKGVAVSSDSDGNGCVTMDEAFTYAKSNDRITQEHPQYLSTPLSVGEDLAFNHIAPSIDLYVKDNDEDTGKEPNLTTDKFWISPSIWVRNKADGIEEHENPYYSIDHETAKVYVRVHNRGKQTCPANKYFMHGYWALASTGFSQGVWKGAELYIGELVTGGHMQAKAIPLIEPGGEAVVCLTWTLPDELLGSTEDNYTEKHHFCLLARIMEVSFDDGYVDVKKYFDVKNLNDQAQKNVSIITREELSKQVSVFVRNNTNTTQEYSLELVPRNSDDEQFYSLGCVEVEMASSIYTSWSNGGMCGNQISPQPAISPTTVVFTSKDSKLQAIAMPGAAFDKVKLKFSFKLLPCFLKTYTFDLIQRDGNGNIIGGETFIVESPKSGNTSIDVELKPVQNGYINMSANAASDETLTWTNENGEAISHNNSINVKSSAKCKSFTVAALSQEGELSTQSVMLEMQDEIVGAAFIGSDKSTLSIELTNPAPDDASIMLSSATNSVVIVVNKLTAGDTQISIDTSSLPEGVYIITLKNGNNVISTRKISK